MMRRMLFAVALALPFCSHTDAQAQQPVYPLHIGDRWQYALQPGTARIDQDSLMPNGQRYAQMDFGFGRAATWERTAGNRVFRYDSQTGQDHVWYDFTLSVGDTVSIIPTASDSTIITFVGSGTHDLFGATRRWWCFLIDYMPAMLDDEEFVTITDSIGLTNISTVWYTSAIQGAIIDGRQYGVVHKREHGQGLMSGPQLYQNYPNPFNPSTTLSFDIQHSTFVILKVFDILGREVATLVNDRMEAGTHRVAFNAEGLTGGVYIFRMQAGGFTEARTMLLLR